MAVLRDYQERAIENLRKEVINGNRRVVFALPTGGGKSIVFGQIIKNAVDKGNTVLWLVHRRNLVLQMRDTLRDHFGIEAGVIMSGLESDTDNQVQIGTIQTYSRRLNLDQPGYNRFYISPDVLLIDEGHRSVSKTYKDVINLYLDRVILACTATPMRGDGRGLGEIYQSIVDIAGVRELTERGFLAPARYFAPVDVDLSGVKTAMGDYVVKDLDGKINKTKLIGDIVENWLKIAENRQTIIFCVNVKHAIAVCDAFNKAGIPSEHLNARSSDDEREDVFRRMENGDLKVITNVALYQEGLDVPNISCIGMARPTKFIGLYRQCCGRGLRPSPGKKDCLILDFGGVIEEHGLLDWEIEWSLDGKEKAWSKPSRTKTERLVKCRACHKVFMGANTCPDCGTKVMSYGKKIATIEAELAEINTKEKFTIGDKRHWYGMFLYYSRKKGYRDGWAAHKYRGRFKKWPNNIRDVAPVEPTPEFNNYMRHLTIRWVKAKQKSDREARDRLQRGGELVARFQSSQV